MITIATIFARKKFYTIMVPTDFFTGEPDVSKSFQTV